MATTSSGIWTPDAADLYKLVVDLAAMADTIEAALPPAGQVAMWPVDAAPNGWLICNGAAVSRTNYARLYDVIGTTYGPGNGSTTFNLPNWKGRVPVGVDSAQPEFATMGKTGGEKQHTLTRAEMPNIAGTFGVVVPDSHSSHRTGDFVGVTVNPSSPNAKNLPTANGTIYGYGINVGGNGAHNNLQPYMTVNFIIRA